MELLVQSVTESHEFINGARKIHRRRHYLEGVTLGANGNIEGIAWMCLNIGSSLDLHWLPPPVGALCMEQNDLSRSMNFRALPQSLRHLLLPKNRFSCCIAVNILPDGFAMLSLSKVNFKKAKQTLTFAALQMPNFLSAFFEFKKLVSYSLRRGFWKKDKFPLLLSGINYVYYNGEFIVHMQKSIVNAPTICIKNTRTSLWPFTDLLIHLCGGVVH